MAEDKTPKIEPETTELSEKDLDKVAGGAVDAFIYFNDPAGKKEPSTE